MDLYRNKGVAIFGFTEVGIGIFTLTGHVVYKLFFGITKPLPVFLFILFSSLVSLALGIGILNYKPMARKMLVYFAGYIIMTKIFIFSGLITLSPDLEEFVPSVIKNIGSIAYHAAAILYFNRRGIKDMFL